LPKPRMALVFFLFGCVWFLFFCMRLFSSHLRRLNIMFRTFPGSCTGIPSSAGRTKSFFFLPPSSSYLFVFLISLFSHCLRCCFFFPTTRRFASTRFSDASPLSRRFRPKVPRTGNLFLFLLSEMRQGAEVKPSLILSRRCLSSRGHERKASA